MIAIWLGKALSVLKAIPREVWYIAAAVLALWLWGNHREDAGREAERAVWIARLEKAEADAKAKAEKAAKSADKAQQQRTDEFEAEQDTLTKEIEDANRSGDNALDAVLRSLR